MRGWLLHGFLILRRPLLSPANADGIDIRSARTPRVRRQRSGHLQVDIAEVGTSRQPRQAPFTRLRDGTEARWKITVQLARRAVRRFGDSCARGKASALFSALAREPRAHLCCAYEPHRGLECDLPSRRSVYVQHAAGRQLFFGEADESIGETLRPFVIRA